MSGQGSAANGLTNAANGFPVTHNPTLVSSLQKKYSLWHAASIISNYLRFIDTFMFTTTHDLCKFLCNKRDELKQQSYQSHQSA